MGQLHGTGPTVPPEVTGLTAGLNPNGGGRRLVPVRVRRAALPQLERERGELDVRQPVTAVMLGANGLR